MYGFVSSEWNNSWFFHDHIGRSNYWDVGSFDLWKILAAWTRTLTWSKSLWVVLGACQHYIWLISSKMKPSIHFSRTRGIKKAHSVLLPGEIERDNRELLWISNKTWQNCFNSFTMTNIICFWFDPPSLLHLIDIFRITFTR